MNKQVSSPNRQARRTRQLLHDALKRLLQEKSFHALTVNDLAEQAGLNRGTFYLHFTDKYALLDDYIREEFQHVLLARLSPSASLSRETLHLLALTTLEYLAQTYERCRSSDKPVESLLERAVQQEVYHTVLKWLTQDQKPATSSLVSAETMAMVVSWSIFGAGIQRRQGHREISSEALAQQITTALLNALSSRILVLE
ncbi:TetR/AcrR family transcriptional regulator [Ktedonosporobacter rubrisoli]|uniref:TetR/AcrR family transcriptional regulator n=1 Tax=Ktedonosporobacter rubrisoli TaxID=2509675 RepID=A0A4P6JN65_KTERU|nr:TetR/AcrR family transcriptional regulator [Ktedonosporobacter rubrisoli]QBD76593.1 TetR/AcrR family transcriptional regulator [Ktedonosporobacter rubrisoli]